MNKKVTKLVNCKNRNGAFKKGFKGCYKENAQKKFTSVRSEPEAILVRALF